MYILKLNKEIEINVGLCHNENLAIPREESFGTARKQIVTASLVNVKHVE